MVFVLCCAVSSHIMWQHVQRICTYFHMSMLGVNTNYIIIHSVHYYSLAARMTKCKTLVPSADTPTSAAGSLGSQNVY
jgi:hypothetical protein